MADQLEKAAIEKAKQPARPTFRDLRVADAKFRVYGPDFRIERKELFPQRHGQPAPYRTEQKGWWREASSLKHARELAEAHGDGRYLIVRFLPAGLGAVRWERDRQGGQEIYVVTDGVGYSVKALT
jgi:hypothetical protein